MFLTSFQVPQLAGLIHGTGGEEVLVGIEGHSNYLILMSNKGMQKVSSLSIPKFGCLVKRTCGYFIACIK